MEPTPRGRSAAPESCHDHLSVLTAQIQTLRTAFAHAKVFGCTIDRMAYISKQLA
jgi:hypothetical protein